MPVLACCPRCRFEAPLPDDDPGGRVACPKCGAEFEPALIPVGTAVWVDSATPPPRRGLNPLPTHADGAPVTVTAANAGKHLDWLKAEVARFDAYVARQLEAVRTRRDELAATEAALVARTLRVSRDEAALAAERESLAGRAEALLNSERDLERRLSEVDELEHQLRGELEGREAEVERQRRDVEAALAELRSRAPLTGTADGLLDAGHCG